MKEIKLSQHGENKGKYVALVDDEDYDYLNQWKWHVDIQNRAMYVTRNCRKGDKVIRILMHREIINPPIDSEVDHIDHNGLNNQKNNIRICTHAQNSMNRKPKGASGYLGVYYHYEKLKNGIKKRIYSSIGVNGVSVYLGEFITEEDAALAYDIAAKKYFGEFANLNFPR